MAFCVLRLYDLKKKNVWYLEKIYKYIFPIPWHVKQKGKFWCSYKIQKLSKSNIWKKMIYSITSPASRNLQSSDQTHKAKNFYITLTLQISFQLLTIGMFNLIQYITYMLSYWILFYDYITFCITWSSVSFLQARKITLPKVSNLGETGVVKRVPPQILFLWFLHRSSNEMHPIKNINSIFKNLMTV